MTSPVIAPPPAQVRISVIIPTFNRADLLAETIEAVLAQTRAPDEILVVDDGSSDHTRAILERFGDKVNMISKPNSGKADSLNMAMKASRGSHIWIVDDDDIPRPDGLAILTSVLAANKGAQLVYGRHVRFSQEIAGGAKTYQETGYWDMRGSDYFLIATLEDFFVHQPAMLVARTLYDQVGPFNTEMIASEDYEMLIRLARYGKVAATEQVIFEQRVHSGIRGQKGHQFTAADRNRKWIDYDQKIFRTVHKDLPLDTYLPRGGCAGPSAQTERQARIQRSAIMARKKLWDLALNDLQAIVAGDHHGPLTDTERTILRRALLSKYGCDELFDSPEILSRLQDLASTSAFGRALVRGIGRSLLWHFRTELVAGGLGRARAFMAVYLKLR